jgi:hypothetical protein
VTGQSPAAATAKSFTICLGFFGPNSGLILRGAGTEFLTTGQL